MAEKPAAKCQRRNVDYGFRTVKGKDLLAALRNARRGYKFAVLLLAAWAPLLLPNYPAIAGVTMGLATAVFLVATGPRKASKTAPASNLSEGPDGPV